MRVCRYIFLHVFLCFLFFVPASFSHLCDNVFRQADKLIVKPENYNMVIKDSATFKIFLQNNMDRGIAEISLVAESPAFDFEITPQKMPVPKDRKVYFEVTMRPKKEIKTGNYPVNFRLVGGGRQFKSFSLDMSGSPDAKDTSKPLAEDASRLLRVRPAAGPPVIDGEINDTCWKTGAVLSNFSSLTGGKAIYQTHALAAFDRDNLYFGFHFNDENEKGLSYKDKIEIRLSLSTSGYPCYSIIVPARGPFQFKKEGGFGDVISYTPEGIKYSAAVGIEYWTAEVAVPFSALGKNPASSNEIWYLRLIRTKANGAEETSYWAADSSGYNREEGFGALLIIP